MNHARFLAELIDDPSNDAAKLVYADWLEEQGDSRAEFLRVVVEGRDGRQATAEEIANAAGIAWRESYLRTIRESDLPPELFVSFGLDCAERLLPLFDKSRPVDVQTRKDFEAARDNQDDALHFLSRLAMYFG
ncbi:MAG: TIGR02996 domain-containing protein, partial [Planctomycetales bacterium]